MVNELGTDLVLMIGVTSSLISLIVGLIALNSTRDNAKVIKAKFKFQLFEKRHEVFMATWRFMADLLQKDPITTTDILNFSNNTANAKFLFDAGIVDFLEEVRMKGIRLGTAEYTLARPSSDEVRQQMSTERHNIVSWVETEMRVVKERFKPYLDVSEWK